ncbi:MAG: hypothetical protein KDK39_15950 [Leptospiraceae bacterium]|nr:hypothetical protein [Leptospiraceae bacterium]
MGRLVSLAGLALAAIIWVIKWDDLFPFSFLMAAFFLLLWLWQVVHFPEKVTARPPWGQGHTEEAFCRLVRRRWTDLGNPRWQRICFHAWLATPRNKLAPSLDLKPRVVNTYVYEINQIVLANFSERSYDLLGQYLRQEFGQPD